MYGTFRGSGGASRAAVAWVLGRGGSDTRAGERDMRDSAGRGGGLDLVSLSSVTTLELTVRLRCAVTGFAAPIDKELTIFGIISNRRWRIRLRTMTDGIAYELLRVRMRDGEETTVYPTRHPLASTGVSVICFDEPARLDHWCAANRRPEAIVAGFFMRDRTGRSARSGSAAPSSSRAGGGAVGRAPGMRAHRRDRAYRGSRGAGRRAGRRPRAGRTAAGARRRSVIDGSDDEGFPPARQFDSDITVGRYPRCALASPTTSCSPSAATGAARASTPGSSSASWRGCCLVRRARGDQPRRRWSATLVIAAISSTAPTRSTTSPRQSRGRSSPRCCSTRCDPHVGGTGRAQPVLQVAAWPSGADPSGPSSGVDP